MHKAGATTGIPLLPSNLHIKQLRQRVKKTYSCRKEVLHDVPQIRICYVSILPKPADKASLALPETGKRRLPALHAPRAVFCTEVPGIDWREGLSNGNLVTVRAGMNLNCTDQQERLRLIAVVEPLEHRSIDSILYSAGIPKSAVRILNRDIP